MTRLTALIILLFPLALSAQHLEVGLMGGLSLYDGELSPTSRVKQIGDSRLAYGAFARYNLNEYFAAKLNIYKGTITGDDANTPRSRNLNFESEILEIGLTGEFNVFGFRPIDLADVLSPYIFAGIAYYRYDPYTTYNGDQVFLQPLGTEGQGMPDRPAKYSLGQFSIPLGVGIKYAINDKINIGVEFGVRRTFTDYLDDVSGTYADNDSLAAANGPTAAALANRSGNPIAGGADRGNSEYRDWYMMGGITVSYNFMDSGLAGFRKHSRSRNGCPTF